ncbi:outer membrane cobalamin receptor [Mucilaginibacter oryzae]|uniref:Outer membrane cobalamin receptor n=1 Tax=Mucilaginibacter oryzae TaxID=468058 RepID=A0A316HAD1_9SPHI|nr:TonB-dependent receptor [Mucilaginibacter oryzae]PWK77253.1 outer membrane cobalamin receptor [Mucilaginibacter oryzae]
MTGFFTRLALLLASLIWTNFLFAQVSLYGRATGPHGEGLPGTIIRVGAVSAVADSAGNYRLNGLQDGQATLQASLTGYHALVLLVDLHQKNNHRDLRLIPQEVALSEVTVKGKTAVSEAREQPQHLTVIDLKPYYDRPEGALTLLNQAAGVKVRQQGGLGSQADYYLNGLSGKQVRFFIDDLPLDFLGPGLNINLLPANVIDRIDVYKGVVPVRLGADALGGAINVITRHNAGNYLDASYALSSFNTQRATLSLHRNINAHFFTDVTAFYNTTRNNYPVDVNVINSTGNPVPVTVNRFHDGFHNLFASTKAGIKDLSWADELSLNTSWSGVSQQVQNNPVMTQPYGQVTYSNNARSYLLNYRKRRDKWSVNLAGGRTIVNGHYVDTSLNTYNWYGRVVARRSSGGESFGPLTDLHNRQISDLLRGNATYVLDQQTGFEFSGQLLHFRQTENNPATAAFPVNLDQKIFGFAFNRSFLDQRLSTITSVKYFDFGSRGYQFSSGGDISAASAAKQQWGWNEALRYVFTSVWSAKASYEYAARLPDQTELFGTYIQRTRPNPSLVPETSHNVNTGITAAFPLTGFSLNGFYRLADHLIYAPPSTFFLLYQNLLKAQFTGAEAEYWLKPWRGWRLDLNATYQNIINRSPAGNSGDADNRHDGLRLPNIPFLFANGQLLWNHEHAFQPADRFSAWLQGSYVHWYYLYWANDGDASTKAIIPTQFTATAGISYAFARDRYALSMEVKNLTDGKVYDNYSVQLPGRSFHLKLHFLLK